MLQITDLPHVNAALNGATIVFLAAGLAFILTGRRAEHRACMIGALSVSVAFLVSYLVYHFNAGLAKFGGEGMVLGIDIDIRPPNRHVIEGHAMAKRIRLIEGSSVADEVVAEARALAAQAERVLVVLDSNHTHEHVLHELQLYSPLVTRGSYLVAFDTIIEDMPEDFYPDRPWGRGDNAKTAVLEFLAGSDAFEVDRAIEHKLQITVAPNGYLRRVRD